jgi:hypothetical protein
MLFLATILVLIFANQSASAENPLQIGTFTPSVTKTINTTPTITRTATITKTATLTKTSSPTITPSATLTPTPRVEENPVPKAWLDSSVNIWQMGAMDSLIIHFNTPMSISGSIKPILVWPGLEGNSSWNAEATTLTYKPGKALDPLKTYTFFLNPALRAKNGKSLDENYQWVIRINSGLKIVAISPEAGTLTARYNQFEITFNRDMYTSDPPNFTGKISFQPAIQYELKWKTKRVLRITINQPFAPGERYHLTVIGGNKPDGVFAADGSYLLEDMRWSYWQTPLEVIIKKLKTNAINIDFNYLFNPTESGEAFAISPPLQGTWKWISGKTLNFQADEPILASTLYTLSLSKPLVDVSGMVVAQLQPLTFSGAAPLRLANKEIKNNTYNKNLTTDINLESIKIEFDQPVEHASAEKSFSINPSVPGKFLWQENTNGTKEVLVYQLSEMLQPSIKYTVSMDPGIMDIEGNAFIALPFEQEFYTNYWAFNTPSFGEAGDNIQVVDAAGPRTLQFAGGGDGISFAAYRFELIDFARLYADYYHSRRWIGVRDVPIPDDLKPESIWTDIVTRESDDGSITETIIPYNLPAGLYVLNMRVDNRLYDQLFLVVSVNTLVVKNEGDELFVWLSNINGVNVSGAEIRLYNSKSEKIRVGETDENGLYRIPISPDVDPMLVSARVRLDGQPDDVTLSGFLGWESNTPSVPYFDPSRNLPVRQPYLIYIYTERPIYRPGQTVNFKAIVRRDDDVRYSMLPTGSEIQVRILDSHGNSIKAETYRTNRFGSIHGDLNISEGAALGEYQVEVTVDGQTTSQIFKIEDYSKPDYQVSITSLQLEKEGIYVRGEEVKVQINVAYYFGEPLAKTGLKIKLIDHMYMEKELGTMTTDENGMAELTFKAPFDGYYLDRSYPTDVLRMRMQVTADDGSNQEVTGIYNFSVYAASEQLKLDCGGFFFSPDDTISVTGTDLDIFGQAVAGRKLTLTTHTWNRETYDYDKDTQTYELTTDENGQVQQDLKLPSGYYQLVLSGQDDQKHDLERKTWIYVFKDEKNWFKRSSNPTELSIAAEKETYKPYENARFIIESNFSGPALLTYERGTVINSKMIELTAPLTVVETMIIPEHAPNVYVTVNAWQPASADVHRYNYWYYTQTEAVSYLRVANTSILVDAGSKELDISIETDKQVYAPGETLNAEIQVNDSAGNPVLAELSLAVVDEAIFGIASDPAKDIFEAFYGPRRNSVLTYDSMAPSRIIFEGGRGGGGDGTLLPPRSNFPDTSAWMPVIVTDTNGKASVSINLPDNTTSWRLTVKAHTLSNQVGQAITNIETKKEIFLRPDLPGVLTKGDLAELTAYIHNYSTYEQELTVNLTAPGLSIQGEEEQTVVLVAGEVAAVKWRVEVQSPVPVDLTFTVSRSDEVLDAVRLPLNLQPAATKDIQNQSGQFLGSLSLALPVPELERETSRVTLSLNRSMSGTLLNGLEFLTGYPYGCVEQTMSRALPNAVVGRAASQLGVGGEQLQNSLQPLIEASINQLYGLQHGDGGWGWWTDDQTDTYQTAWVLFGLGILQDSGYQIEERVIDSAVKKILETLQYNSEMDVRTQAYALFSLSQVGRGDLDRTRRLIETSLDELDAFSQAALALALNNMGETDLARKIIAALSNNALIQNGQVSWPQTASDGEYHQKTMASSTRTTALTLLAYVKTDPTNPLIPAIVDYLAAQRKGIYGWGTTNETSFTILALTEYLIYQESNLTEASFRLEINGESYLEDTLIEGQTGITLDIPLSELKDGLNMLVLNSDSAAPLFYDLSTNYDLLQSDVKAAGNIKITRRYLDPKTKKALSTFQEGQLVKVEIQLDVPQYAAYMAVEDYLPGGLEALNENLSASMYYRSRMGDSYYYEYDEYYRWQGYGYNYKEIRADRVVFFITTMEKGKYTYSYIARAATSGTFLALPAQAYAMYDFSLWGRSNNAVLQVAPLVAE